MGFQRGQSYQHLRNWLCRNINVEIKLKLAWKQFFHQSCHSRLRRGVKSTVLTQAYDVFFYMDSWELSNKNALTWTHSGKAVKHSSHAVHQNFLPSQVKLNKTEVAHETQESPTRCHVCWERHLWQRSLDLLTCMRLRLIQDVVTLRKTQHIPSSASLA